MTVEIKNPRIIEIMTVQLAIACMKLLNTNDLKSLNIRWAKERVEAMKEQCEGFLNEYSEEKIADMEKPDG